jgi:hypothetical protein
MGCWAEYKRDKNVNTFCLTFYVQNLMDNLQSVIKNDSVHKNIDHNLPIIQLVNFISNSFWK